MIVIKTVAGFGNQMFEYAFYLFMKKLYSDKTAVFCDLTWYNHNHENKRFLLRDVFPNLKKPEYLINEAGFSDIYKASGLIPNCFSGGFGAFFDKFRRYPNRIIREFTIKKRRDYMFDENDDGFYEKITNLDTDRDYYISGYFLNEKYYSKVIDEVKEAFAFPEIQDDRNKEYLSQINNRNSVSVHIRRGDYLSDLYKDKFISLGRDYYKKAVGYINERMGDPVFFMFSDDPDYVAKEFRWIDNIVIVAGNDGKESFRDMQLMSMCKANITANSTFSLWGAILNQNKNNIVIYPKQYLYGQDSEIISAANWIRM